MPEATVIEHVDEPTPLGFSAVEVLARLAGRHGSALEWLEPRASDEYVLAYGPEHGPSTLALDLRAADGPIIYRYRTPRFDAPEGTTCAPGFLQIPVEVALSSGGRALDESFEAVIEAGAVYRARLSKQLAPGALSGGLGFEEVSSLDPERAFWLGPLTLEAEVWEGGSRGSLGVQVGASHVKESKALRAAPEPPLPPGALAVWPSAQTCEEGANALPSDARVLGFSASDVLERLRQGGPRQLAWSDGSVTDVRLSLQATEPELCQAVGETLSFGVTLRAQSPDGNLDVSLPVRIEASSNGGALGEISLESIEPNAPQPVAGLGQEPRAMLQLGAYTSVLIGVQWAVGNDREVGELSLRGVDSPTPDEEGNYRSTALTSGQFR